VPETDALMDKATVETNDAERSKLYAELIKRVSDASPVVYVLELRYPTVINKQFKNVIETPLGIYGNFATANRQ
jgi:peptide/nickel transport system substrate-binding protein